MFFKSLLYKNASKSVVVFMLLTFVFHASIGSGTTIPLDPRYEEPEKLEAKEVDIRRFCAIPAENAYSGWDNVEIHPYKFTLADFEDSVKIDLIGTYECEFTLPISGKITSRFGPRRYRYHKGIDIDLYTGDKVSSSFDGVVRIARYSYSYGYTVVVRHYNGLETLYAHLSRLKVKPGDVIDSGEIIGLGGSTGRSSGSHLHYEVRYKGWVIDPSAIISFEEAKLNSNKITLRPGRKGFLISG